MSGIHSVDRRAFIARRGHPARRIEKILGLNFLSFAREVWGG